MTIPALDFRHPVTKRAKRSVADFQRQALEWELCTCPSCLKAFPERRQILLRRRAVLKGRFRVVE